MGQRMILVAIACGAIAALVAIRTWLATGPRDEGADETSSVPASVSTGSGGEPYLEVYVLQHADATEVERLIASKFEGLVPNREGTINQDVYIWGNDVEQRIAAKLIRKLDKPPGSAAGP